ncbi:hypothetical protein [Gynuella sp.]|uniref:VpaChn25_0724 family phage protein n=1 Tax=Gynuella sp. TaxID=2969146 RepID=UPI003D1476C6
MNFNDMVKQEQRLLMLQLLEQDAGYSHNENILHRGLNALGHAVSMDAVRAHIELLRDAGLVTVTQSDAVGMIAKVTNRGLDVAQGNTVVSGVARPLPGG